MPVTTLAVTGKWVNPDGTVAAGRIEFIPISPRTINASEIVPAVTTTAILDTTGSISVTLVRCADGYSVQEVINGQLPYRYLLPDQAGPVDLSSIT